MNETDYFSWLLAFNAYNEKHPDSILFDILSTDEGIIKVKFLIEKFYKEKLEDHTINNLLKKLEREIKKKELKKFLEEIEEDKFIDLIILRKLKKYAQKEQNYIFKNKVNSKTNILSAVEIIREKVDKDEDLEKVVKEYFQEQNLKTSSKKSKKEAENATNDFFDEDLEDEFEDADELDNFDTEELNDVE